jgi:CelD/BcsL family acetyltransferase involved in cellulose biosynthesis
VSGRRGLTSTRPVDGTPTLTLDESWTTPESHFSSRRRADFRTALRRAEAVGTVEFDVLSPAPDEVEALFADIVRVEATGWKVRAGTALAVMDDKREFFARFCESAADEGTLRIAVMRIDGVTVAVQLGAELGGRYWLFKIAYDEAHARCSPGNLLLLHVVGWASERGLTSVEFLGAEEPWIELWTKDVRRCLDVQVLPRAPRSLMAAAEIGARRAGASGGTALRRVRTLITQAAAIAEAGSSTL